MRSVLDLLPLALLAAVAGCDLANDAGEFTEGQERPPGVTVSLNSSGDSPGQDAEPETALNDPVVTLTGVDLLLQTIRDLRNHKLPDDAAQAAEVDRQRNLKIVEIATEAIQTCVSDQSRQRQMNIAVKELLESRLRLAISGTDTDVAQLYEDARAFYAADESSAAAAEGIYTLARFAHEMARQSGGEDLRWYENFSRWSREFASRFPNQADRAISLLVGAGRSCELYSFQLDTQDGRRLLTEAKLCFTEVVDRFPDSDAAGEAAATLRRMNLPGQKLTQFAGPTAAGGFFNAEEAAGRVIIIYFWASANREFLEELVPLLHQAEKAGGQKIQFVGVGLDSDVNELEACRSENLLPGLQISFSDDNLRGWDNPLVRFWGISRCPSVWIVDAKGVVRDVDVGTEQLVDRLRAAFQD